MTKRSNRERRSDGVTDERPGAVTEEGDETSADASGEDDVDPSAGERFADGSGEEGSTGMGVAEEETPGHIDEVAPPAAPQDPKAELAELRDRHLRLAAEFDNFRRRTRKELLETGEAAKAGLAGKLLEVLDDLQRVADTPCDGTTTEALHEGVGLVAKKLNKTLTDAGMEIVDPVGERFDPNYHEALLVAPTDDPEQDGIVSQVILVGYRLGDRLLRPAQVQVYRYEGETA